MIQFKIGDIVKHDKFGKGLWTHPNDIGIVLKVEQDFVYVKWMKEDRDFKDNVVQHPQNTTFAFHKLHKIGEG